MKKKFLRRNWNKYKRLGKGRKKKQIWRRPRGKHSKMRKWRKGYPARVEAGYGSPRKERGKVQGKMPLLVHNIQDLLKATKEHIILVAHVGEKKRKEIIKKAEEMHLPLFKEHHEA